ncbi:unnamed protein product [Wickerhamomyces anomalus]
MDLKSSSIKDLKDLLPIDDESLGQMVDNALSLASQTAITEYWLGLLGESPDALDFIGKFTSRLTKPSAPTQKPKFQSVERTPSPSGSNSGRNVKNPWNQPVAEKQKLINKPRLAKNVNTTTSQLLDKPQEKPSKQSAKRDKQRKVDNLKDLDEILKQLEISDGINTDEKSRLPCSFCGKELISSQEKQQIISMLKNEKNQLESPSKTPEPPLVAKTKKKKITVGSGAGVNLWTQQEALFKKLEAEDLKRAELQKKLQKEAKEREEQNRELDFYNSQKGIDPDLLNAQKNLENLLNFQANSAERTKIIDQASDFEIPTGSNLNMWSSSVEKALQLKKQQKQMRKLEKKQKELTGRGEDHDSEDDEADEEIKKLEQDLQQTKDKKNEEAFQNVWDFEKDKSKWSKPTYTGTEVQDEGSTKDDELKSSKWERVQLPGETGDLEEILVGL